MTTQAEVPRGTPCRFFDRERWVPAVVIRWHPGMNRSVTVECGTGDTAIRYTVGKSRVRLIAAVREARADALLERESE